MSIMPPDSDSKSTAPPCTTMGCPALGSVPGTFINEDSTFDVVYCPECASDLMRTDEFQPADPSFTPVEEAVQGPTRKYVVGTYCPRGGGHFELMSDEDYDGSCGSKGWSLFIEIEDGDDLSQLPEGYFEDGDR